MSRLVLLATLTLTLLAPRWLAAAEPTLEELVDDLQNISEPGYGYTGGRNGSEFLPYPGSGHFGVIVFGGPGVTPSETLKNIVERGAEAIPVLIKHLDDARPTKLPAVKGRGWTVFNDEYDFNRLTAKEKPVDVNRDDSNSRDDPQEHSLTVGDLSFVALGQIVNRSFTAARYQPTAGLAVNSTSYSKRLRAAVVKEWGKLTRDEHRQSLIDDFHRPDYPRRRIGAYQRLAFYYPDVIEKVVVAELKSPVYISEQIWDFKKELNLAKEDIERRQLFDELVKKHGAHYKSGLLDSLFNDLYFEEGRDDQTKANQVRLLLGELFQFPANVKSDDRPHCEYASQDERTGANQCVVHDQSKQIGEMVHDIYVQADRKDESLRRACLECLANRGYAKLLLEELAKIEMAATADQSDLAILTTIATSREPEVRSKLLEMLQATRDAHVLLAILPAFGKDQADLVLQSARVILAEHADDDAGGTEALLKMVRERYRTEARAILAEFVSSKKNDIQRAVMLCDVLQTGDPHPSEVELLVPFLNDQRNIPNHHTQWRVCDIAAYTISDIIHDVEFESSWNLTERDAGIARIKQYCEKQKAADKK